MTNMCCQALLSEALDLCVRARTLDAAMRTIAELDASASPEDWVQSGRFNRHVERHNARHPDQPITSRSGTIPIWIADQYEADLAAWERRARHHLQQGCTS